MPSARYPEPNSLHEPIAVVGMGCRLPQGISSPSDLWDFLSSKGKGVREFDPNRINIEGFYHPDPQRPGSMHTKGACLLDEDPKLFDHSFFGITQAEVLTMDPLQRKLLEVAYEAFESAGEPWDSFSGSSTGVFIGNFNSDHSIMQMHDYDFPLPYSSTGGGASSLSNRISHIFNLRGPSMTIDTACSSSMHAVHLAVNAIRHGDCESAIAGGSNLISGPEMQLMTVKLGALSPTSTCHTFDASADGYGRGEAFGALYLKKYSDAVAGGCPIRAVIRGTSVNANGRTAGMSHPSTEGQETLIRQAYRNAGLPTHSTAYFECHGTGTPVGDPIEVSAIRNVFGPSRDDAPLLIGSVKSNLGHAEPASGVIGMMKAILALERGIIPPTIGVQKLNPHIDFEAARVKVVTEMTPWPRHLPKRVSVNSFGYGGANAHCILDHESALVDQQEQACDPPFGKMNGKYVSHVDTRRLILFVFSGHNEQSLKKNIIAIGNVMSKHSLSDLAYTLSTRRSKFLHRAFAVLDSSCPENALNAEKLVKSKSLQKQPRVGFVFTGQGVQWQQMGASLLVYGEFRKSIKFQDHVLGSLSFSPDWKLEDIISGISDMSVQRPEISQTLCTAIQIALVDLLRIWNINPVVTVGHSSGEIAAAYSAGHLSLPDAIVTAYCRGKSMARNSRIGRMLAVGLAADAVLPLLSAFESEVRIAAVNSPGSVTLSGDLEAINEIFGQLKARGVFARLLETGNNAYHSHHMAGIGESYETLLRQTLAEITLHGKFKAFNRHTSVHWVSSVMPAQTMEAETLGPAYWRQNLESTVQFSRAIELLLTNNDTYADVLIEIGPHSALQTPLKQIFIRTELEHGIKPPIYLSTLKREQDGMQNLLSLCGSLFNLSYPLNLAIVNSTEEIQDNTTRYIHGSVCPTLPTYKYSYSSPIYHENRISREIRSRRYLRHDLLGVLQAGCAKERPVWRNILRVRDVPWLKDHQLPPDCVLPASGYVCLAIEALSQLLEAENNKQQAVCFKLRNVSIKSAMLLPDDEFGLEIMTHLQACSHSVNWFEFVISSVTPNTNVWTSHASGLIARAPSPSKIPEPLDHHLDPRAINARIWYEKFSEIGLGYGQAFQGLSELLSDPEKHISTAKIALNSTEGMFVGPESSYVIHPASLDICHQLALIACHGGQTGRVKHAFIPVFIDNMTVWPSQSCEEWGQGIAVGHLKGLRGAHAAVQMFAQSGQPRLEITRLRCVAYHGGDQAKKKHVQPLASPYTRLIWKPDMSTLSFHHAQLLCPPLVPITSIKTQFATINRLSVYMITEIAKKYPLLERTVPRMHEFLLWIHKSAREELLFSEEAYSASSEDRLLAIKDMCSTLSHVADVQLVQCIFENVHDLIVGKKTGEEIALQERVLNEVRSSGTGFEVAYEQLGKVFDLAGHKNPSMKILELCTGTGAATRVAMRTLGGETNNKRYSTSTVAAGSIALLQDAEIEFSRCHGVNFRELDINRCPIEQGFDQDFDLIVVSQSLYLTADVQTSLRNIRKLLNTKGRLILLEMTRPLLIHGLAYGTFSGSSGLLKHSRSQAQNIEEWKYLLQGADFSGIDFVLGDYESDYRCVSTMAATAINREPDTPLIPSTDTIYVIYHHKPTAFHDALVSELHLRGATPLLIPLGGKEVTSEGRVIMTTDLESYLLTDGEEEDFLHIKQVVARASSFLWLTQGSLLQGDDPKAAIGMGLVRMLTTEDPLSHYGVFHLERGTLDSTVIHQVIDIETRLHAGDAENEYALKDGIIHISRLVQDSSLNERYRLQNAAKPLLSKMPLHKYGPMLADFETPGLLSSLYFKSEVSHRVELADDWIEVKTCAIGLNWKDLAVSAGKTDINRSSSECSGIVMRCGSKVSKFRPGDRVYTLAWANFGTCIRFPASFAQLMRPQDEFVRMASIPVVFCTAIYALRHLGRLQKGERILIQSAAGGLGLAAIQIAQYSGAEIYVTAGTEEKARYLCEVCHIPRERIFSSRDIADIDALMSATANIGFNVILSTSTGDMMHETWRCIAPMGRFIDVGRVDVQNHGTLAMDIFYRNASFSSFDLSIMAEQDPKFCSRLMEEVGAMVREGTIHPLAAIKVFDVSELDQALLYFSRGQHIGKIVVSYETPNAMVKMLPPPPEATFDPGAEYVLAGGLGGLGRCILQWMVGRGAKNLTVLSRSRSPSTEAAIMIEELRVRKIRVELLTCDVTVKEEVNNAIWKIMKHGPIKGILHAAAILNDRLFDTLPYAQWKLGLAAKVQGTVNFHEVTTFHKLPLEFFIMTSSFEAVVALPTQAAYCAANSFQDAFARYRRAQGFPACAFAFGLITELGDFGQRDITQQMIRRNGLYLTGEMDFLKLLEAAFLSPPTDDENSLIYDPLAEAQITTCLEPSRLAEMEQVKFRATPKAPRWYADRKFSHIFRAMEDFFTSGEEKPTASTDAGATTAMIDSALRRNSIEEARSIVTSAIMEQIAGLLVIPIDSVEASKSVADYGIDSLIAVELRNWMILLFESVIPLLSLLDEKKSIGDLSTWIVMERQEKLNT